MDRAIVYAGSIPMDTDFLKAGRYAKEGLGRFAEMVFGVNATAACGLSCSVSTTALEISIGVGSIVAPGVLDANPIGGAGAGLAADETVLSVQYLNSNVQTVTIPTSGIVCTIYAVCQESDIDFDVLPFYNSAQPSQTLAGVSNDGQALPTRRTGTMNFIAATTPPSGPAGGIVVPLYTLVVPSNVTSLAGVTAEAGQVFWPTIPELATMTLLKAVAAPPSIMLNGGTLVIPAWASRIELRAVGGGGGGSTSSASSADTGSFSGSGGGAGGDAWGVYSVDPASSNALEVTIGSAGGQQETGGTTLVSYGGVTLLQAAGGAPGSFYSSRGSSGGGGGAASGGTIWNLTGGWGGDGQNNAYSLSGYGADGPWGGGGRAGADGGMGATKFGAGGGGAYTVASENTVSSGGSGYQGCVMYRFLP
ncbi:glycine-rich domain-containing protein [Brytella acorum]|uniref:Glycine-rich domain-containing protein n=1 Tax=Brytella acorum TaxID=2959299 RepID=A0AA35VB26_9PROT|nr:hypothetical protein [Brytella acorum]MDF3625102.1 hypothetical protein [Brytella acorum]CAI9121019.1 hypothetical protein LMG32879_001863 [Brytella acorum]